MQASGWGLTFMAAVIVAGVAVCHFKNNREHSGRAAALSPASVASFASLALVALVFAGVVLMGRQLWAAPVLAVASVIVPIAVYLTVGLRSRATEPPVRSARRPREAGGRDVDAAGQASSFVPLSIGRPKSSQGPLKTPRTIGGELRVPPEKAPEPSAGRSAAPVPGWDSTAALAASIAATSAVAPASAEAPAPAEAPARSIEPAPIAAPALAGTSAPAGAKAPAAPAAPAPAAPATAPAPVEEPVLAGGLASADESALGGEKARAGKPSPVEEPARNDEPARVREALSSEAPARSIESAHVPRTAVEPEDAPGSAVAPAGSRGHESLPARPCVAEPAANPVPVSEPPSVSRGLEFSDCFKRARDLKAKGAHAVAARLFKESADRAPDEAQRKKARFEELACYVLAGQSDRARGLADELRACGDGLTGAERIKLDAVARMV